jgi:hypothetical protein
MKALEELEDGQKHPVLFWLDAANVCTGAIMSFLYSVSCRYERRR